MSLFLDKMLRMAISFKILSQTIHMKRLKSNQSSSRYSAKQKFRSKSMPTVPLKDGLFTIIQNWLEMHPFILVRTRFYSKTLSKFYDK